MQINRKNSAVVVLIVVLALLLVWGGWYIYQMDRTESVYQDDEEVTAEDEWGIYANPQLGVSFEYPPGWEVTDEDGMTIHIQDTKHASTADTDAPFNGVLIAFNPQEKTSKDWEIGFGGIFWKTIYRPGESVLITLHALDEENVAIADKIAASMRFYAQ